MRARLKWFVWVLLLIVWVPLARAQQITLTRVPYRLIGETNSVTITWLEPIQATLHYGSTHGTYTASISKSGTQSLVFVPQEEGMQPGVYYGIITNGLLRSEEFPFIVEASTSPVMRQPVNNSVVRTATPEFQWDEVSGVPFYHLILSDHEAVISKDENGNLQVTGANIIYQAITSSTHITYSDPDPSGYFTAFNGTTPPLLNGSHYTWIVLNNYGNNPAFSSIVQSGVSSFTVDLNVTLPAPTLVSPADQAVLNGKTIKFQWNPVSGAVNYQIYLFEYIYEENSSSSFLIWNATTSNTSIEFPARAVLKGTNYLWRVLAMEPSGNGMPSESRHFTYQVPVSALKIGTYQIDGTRLARTNVIVSPVSGSSDNVTFVTSDYGDFMATVQPGTYQVRAFKEGFLDTTKSVEVEGGDTLAVALRLRPASYRVSGNTKDAAGQPASAVAVLARENATGRVMSTASDADGHFVLGLTTGLWDIWGQKENYANSDTFSVELGATRNVNLSNPLVLKAFDSFIAGKVVNASGQPVITAEVQASKGEKHVSQFTANNGTFNLQVDSGEWRVTVSKGGYVSPSPRLIQVTAGATANITPDLVLQPNAGILSGFVFGGQKAVGGAQVTATPPAGLAYSALTDPKGAYSLNVAPGNYQITVAKQGYHSPEPLQAVLEAGETLSNLNFSLTPNPVFIAGKTTTGGRPLEGVVVSTSNAVDTSLADGTYKLWVQPGTYRITAQKSGFAANEAQIVTIALGENKTGVDFSLTPDAGIIKGSVQQGNQPVVGALVQAIAGSDTVGTQSNNLGQYALSVKPGAWMIQASKTGFAPKTVNVAVQSGQTVTGIDFNLLPNRGTVSGTVRDVHGRGIPDARIQVANLNIQALTNSSGSYSLQLEPGTYQLKAGREGYGSQTATVRVTANSTVTRNFSLSSKGTLTGRITDSATGSAINHAQIQAISETDIFSTQSDYTGEYTLYLSGGTFLLKADQLGYHARQLTVTILAGALKTQNVALQPDPSEIARISGRILDDFGKPMAGIPISLSGGKVNVIYTETNGTYDVEKLQTGLNYTLRPHWAGFFFVPEKRIYAPLSANQEGQNFGAALYGDVSGNKEVSSFDGSLILRISAQQNVAPYFQNQPRDSIAADVSGNGQVSSFDASLIFRYSVRLINRFPAEPSQLGKELQLYSDPEVHLFGWRFKLLAKGQWEAVIFGNQLNRVYATQWQIQFDSKWVRILGCDREDALGDQALSWSERNGMLFIATAGAKPASASGDFIRIRLRVQDELDNSPAPFLHVKKVEINEGLIPAAFQSTEENSLPKKFELYNNYPNPFNGTTYFRLAVGAAKQKQTTVVNLSIYNVLGQRVKQIVQKKLPPGYYQFKWDGRNEAGEIVPGGVYFYRLKAGKLIRVKKLLFLK